MQTLIKEAFPEVVSVTMKLRYLTDAGTPASMFKEEERVLHSDKVFPDMIKCCQRECINGGFSLGNELRSAISSREEAITGKKVCWGWQDKERVNRHHCLFELHYDIEISYVE